MAGNSSAAEKVGPGETELLLLAETRTFCRRFPHQFVMEISKIILHTYKCDSARNFRCPTMASICPEIPDDPTLAGR